MAKPWRLPGSFKYHPAVTKLFGDLRRFKATLNALPEQLVKSVVCVCVCVCVRVRACVRACVRAKGQQLIRQCLWLFGGETASKCQ